MFVCCTSSTTMAMLASDVPNSSTAAIVGELGDESRGRDQSAPADRPMLDSHTVLSRLLVREAEDFRQALQRSVEATVHQYMARQDQVLAEYFRILGRRGASVCARERRRGGQWMRAPGRWCWL
mmetsp:Transcript_32133/g.102024  ORF Transcript_32133/g.102024 Transcript_32133/m.102024 type:complete len:124 (+) Transcript_32133:57-428(+)